ncbi:hypothetical protein BC826DRAFT_1039490, partial [Russula brevipes]
MSLHNINDPEGVKALLDTLRSSQAWAAALESSLVAHPTTQPPAQSVRQSDSLHVPAPGPGDSGQTSIRPSSISGNPSHSTPSVAELLSQLCASQSPELTSNATQGDRTLERPPLPPESANPSPVPVPKPDPPHTSQPYQDIRTLSFQHALPHISRIMEDPHVVENLSKMKEEQDKLEKQLWREREDIRRKHEEKVKVAKNKYTTCLILLFYHSSPLQGKDDRSRLVEPRSRGNMSYPAVLCSRFSAFAL